MSLRTLAVLLLVVRPAAAGVLSFVLFVKTDWDHVIPVPEQVISTLMARMG